MSDPLPFDPETHLIAFLRTHYADAHAPPMNREGDDIETVVRAALVARKSAGPPRPVPVFQVNKDIAEWIAAAGIVRAALAHYHTGISVSAYDRGSVARLVWWLYDLKHSDRLPHRLARRRVRRDPERREALISVLTRERYKDASDE